MDICLPSIRASFLYLFFKARTAEIETEVKEIPTRASFGSRLSLDFREKDIDGFSR